MVNKRGESEDVHIGIKFLLTLGVFAVIIFLWTVITKTSPIDLGLNNLGQLVNAGDLQSYKDLTGNDNLEFLDYIFGKVPTFLTETLTGGKGAAYIIMIGMWVMFFFIFSDIAVLFSTFRPYIGWIIGFVLTVMAANLKVTTYLAVYVTAFTAGFGVISVGVALVFMIILFLLFTFGSEWAKKFLISRKTAELELRSKIGAARAGEGVKVAKTMQRAAAEGE